MSAAGARLSGRDRRQFLEGDGTVPLGGGNGSEHKTQGLTWVSGTSSGVGYYREPAEIQRVIDCVRTPPGQRRPAQKDALVRLLQSVPLFQRLPKEHIVALGTAAGVRHYKRGEVICAEGEVGEEFYVILDGKVDLILGGHFLRLGLQRARRQLRKKQDSGDAIARKRTASGVVLKAVEALSESTDASSTGDNAEDMASTPRVMDAHQEANLRKELAQEAEGRGDSEMAQAHSGSSSHARTAEGRNGEGGEEEAGDEKGEEEVTIGASERAAMTPEQQRAHDGVQLGVLAAPASFGELALLAGAAGTRSCTCKCARYTTSPPP
jgi:CRP-like cAMP-binding protein